MTFVKLTLVCLALVCATSLFSAFAQSGGTPLPQVTPTPIEKYRVVFADKATMSSFVEQLNKRGEERYRLKTSTWGYQDFFGEKFEKELARLQESGAVYRMVYRDQNLENQLVFERTSNVSDRSVEYRVLTLKFQLVAPPKRKGDRVLDPRVELTPEAKETVTLLNDLARQGFVVRDLFRPKFISNNVSVLLERSR